MRESYAAERAKTYVLSAGTLARFSEGLTWKQILDITAGHQEAWWRCAVAESEQRGLLEWDRAGRCWRLTDDGRVHVRGVS